MSQSSDADVCDADALLCTEGAIGPLCGSCDQDYVYRGETKTCVACGSAKKFAFTALGVAGAAVVALIVLAAGYRHKNPVSQFIKSMDSGSLKVLWVTYQIIMSVSWNLDIEVNLNRERCVHMHVCVVSFSPSLFVCRFLLFWYDIYVHIFELSMCVFFLNLLFISLSVSWRVQSIVRSDVGVFTGDPIS